MSPRKRAEPGDVLEKTGYRIPRSVASMVRDAVDAGEARSQNEFVERALRRELQAVQQRRLYDEYARAAQDAAFMSDLERTDAVYDPTVADGLGESEP